MNIIKNISNKLLNAIYKIKDYDRLESDYSELLYIVSNGLLSKTNYKLQSIMPIINDTLDKYSIDIIKDDIEQIINNNTDNSIIIKEIKEYLSYYEKQITPNNNIKQKENVFNTPNVNTSTCQHDNCPKCNGTGVDGCGNACIHYIFCNCEKCTPRY